MEQRCNNCRHINLNYDDVPCKDCSHCSSSNQNNPSYWAPQIEDINDPAEKFDAILENQEYIRDDIRRLREEINKLSDEITELISLVEERSNKC